MVPPLACDVWYRCGTIMFRVVSALRALGVSSEERGFDVKATFIEWLKLQAINRYFLVYTLEN